MKLVFMAIALASAVLAVVTPPLASRVATENFCPRKMELQNGTLLPYEMSSSGYSSLEEAHQSCKDSYEQAYCQPLSFYKFNPSRIIQRSGYSTPHAWHGQNIGKKRFDPHEENWSSTFWTGQWEEIYSKCFHALEELGYKGSMAHRLLHKYGCRNMGFILQLRDIDYYKAVAEELLKRQREDLQGRSDSF